MGLWAPWATSASWASGHHGPQNVAWASGPWAQGPPGPSSTWAVGLHGPKCAAWAYGHHGP
eukprot:4581558-Karenia_brevis.AAC.1